MKSEDSARSGCAAPQPVHHPAELGGGMAAVHRRQHPVGARLHRQVQVGHQRRQLAMRGDQLVVHVARMAGGVAQPQQAGDLRQFAQQPRQPPGRAARAFAMIGIHVLPEQRDLPRPGRDQPPRLRQHRRHRARILGAAGIGDHAEGAELVAALLHRQEGGHALARGLLRQVVEFLLDGEFGLDHRPRRPAGPRHHLRQPVIGLRPQHDIHPGRARGDLGALGLGDAAGDRQHQALARRLAVALDQPQPAELGEQLVRRLLPDVAGIEDDHVGRLGASAGA